MKRSKIVLLLILITAVILYVNYDLGRYLSLDFVQSRLAEIQAFKEANFALAALIYFVIYVVATALSVPGATIITLVGGAIFGLGWGLLLVSFASSIGATAAFLVSRLLLRDWVQDKFGAYLAPINKGIEKDGSFYLFTLRMLPLFPFFMVNLLMGLTPIKTSTYYLVSQLGMLLGTAVYVNAGSELAQITSLSGLVSPALVFSFALLALFPLVAKAIIEKVQLNKIMKPYPRPKKFDANVVVIGAGSAGLVSSLITAGAKAKVVLVEKHRMGGDCLNTGCVPSKALIRSGRMMSYIRRAKEFGLEEVSGKVDFAAVMDRIQQIIKKIEPHDSVERFTSLGVDCVMGDAVIESPYRVRVGDRVITTRSIILATGARPLVPPIPGLDTIDYLTSDTIWSLRELPKRLLIVGGGPIGCELAQAFNNLGSEVIQVDMAERIMPREDEDVSAAVTARFEQEGIRVLTGHRLVKFESRDGIQLMQAQFKEETVTVEFDQVLLAIGRKANVEGFGLEALNMPLNPGGTIEVNEYLQTAYPNIYACGDVVGPYQFTHMASYQAWFASLNAMIGGIRKSKVNYRVVPWATFTDPEVARVGLSEIEAKQQNIAYELTRFELDDLDRAIADGEAHGFIKVLTVPGKDKILGVTIVGYHAGELIGEFVFAMTHGMGLKKISAVTHIYPSLLEANKFAANAWRSARLPVKYFPLAEKFFRWQRGG
ncbi:MAG: pyridine nucleotide-disulfide oxidoreductase [SAR86 cluster bacterium]|uniref:Pyridine nucleotide-disulfide oxidoreductase n=1 Tax=SAR86 cluster bacterium TaxID=2030880 RepID=A0A2A4MSP7_9GAMM|nr:MAG: pyridine nucleotide-disulfide oxidoreductase [SAR86 cluster bacterium]